MRCGAAEPVRAQRAAAYGGGKPRTIRSGDGALACHWARGAGQPGKEEIGARLFRSSARLPGDVAAKIHFGNGRAKRLSITPLNATGCPSAARLLIVAL